MDKNNLDEPVFKDNRGEIRRQEIAGVKFNILHTKKGVFRSGDYHPNTQFDFILNGKVEVTFRENDKDIKKIFDTNQLIIIPKEIPHLFNFIEETVMLEWWQGSFEAKYFKPYRDIVEKNLIKNNQER